MPLFSLLDAHAPLAAYRDDPERLDRERMRRFGIEPPPPYRPRDARSATESPPILPPTEEDQRRLESKVIQLRYKASKSEPVSQFHEQVNEEMNRFEERFQEQRRRGHLGEHVSAIRFRGRVKREIRAAWIRQGIWDNDWGKQPTRMWRHEWPWVESLLDSDPDTEAEEAPKKEEKSIFTFGPRPPSPFPPPPPRRPRTAEEKQQARAQRREALLKARNQTRPLQQFLYQVDEERERLVRQRQSELGACRDGSTGHGPGHDRASPTPGPSAQTRQASQNLQNRSAGQDVERSYGNAPEELALPPIDTPDISTRAYEAVRAAWVKRKIWRDAWGVLPGTSWSHELSNEELVRENLGPDAVARMSAASFTLAHRDIPPTSVLNMRAPDSKRMKPLLEEDSDPEDIQLDNFLAKRRRESRPDPVVGANSPDQTEAHTFSRLQAAGDDSDTEFDFAYSEGSIPDEPELATRNSNIRGEEIERNGSQEEAQPDVPDTAVEAAEVAEPVEAPPRPVRGRGRPPQTRLANKRAKPDDEDEGGHGGPAAASREPAPKRRCSRRLQEARESPRNRAARPEPAGQGGQEEERKENKVKAAPKPRRGRPAGRAVKEVKAPKAKEAAKESKAKEPKAKTKAKAGKTAATRGRARGTRRRS